MTIATTAGRSGVSVTSASEVDLLSTDTTGIAVPTAYAWTLTVSTNQSITVRVYVAAGDNVGLALVSGYTSTVTSSAPLVLQQSDYPATRIRVTGQASSTTATVSCDFIASRGSVN